MTFVEPFPTDEHKDDTNSKESIAFRARLAEEKKAEKKAEKLLEKPKKKRGRKKKVVVPKKKVVMPLIPITEYNQFKVDYIKRKIHQSRDMKQKKIYENALSKYELL